MMKYRVRNEGDALAYLIDCTLATVNDLATKKSRSVYEFIRQKNIAQAGIDWAVQFGVDLSTTRAKDVLPGTVEEWARKFDVKAPK